MKQWDIWTCDFAEAGPQPAVVVSHPDRIARAPLVNMLIGSSQQAIAYAFACCCGLPTRLFAFGACHGC